MDTARLPQGTEYPLNAIYFYLTDGCNLRCRHCWISPGFEPGGQGCNFLSPVTFRSIIGQAKPLGLSTAKLTGGEPLLHPQIHDIVEFLRSEGIGISIETNGVLLTPELAAAIAAGIRPRISVSLDGVDASTHEWVRGVDGCFEQAVEGIKNAVAAGIRTEVIMTLMRHNAGQIEEMVSLAEKLGASALKFNILQPVERGQKLHEAGQALDIETIDRMGCHIERDLQPQTRLKLIFSRPIAFRSLSHVLDGKGTGCAICGIKGILGVLADGSYALCGIGEHVPDLVFGHAPEDHLALVWHNASLLRQLREGLPGKLEGICGECVFKSLCLGGCIAQNYYASKTLWAPFWYCKEAQAHGLFPPGRTVTGMTGTHGRQG
jgi:SynChlorMet cassette radical SAM/SPASM protein ScmF